MRQEITIFLATESTFRKYKLLISKKEIKQIIQILMSGKYKFISIYKAKL